MKRLVLVLAILAAYAAASVEPPSETLTAAEQGAR